MSVLLFALKFERFMHPCS